MPIIAVPYHLDERLTGFAAGVPVDREVTVSLPPGDPWTRMAALYERVAAAVGDTTCPLVISGDCTTSLGVLAGLQRAGHDVGIVWFDAHADFHTEVTTTSGYLGGLPLALAVGVGTPTLPTALGLRPVPESRVLLVDARDTDPGEEILLGQSAVRRASVQELADGLIPDRGLYLHVDLDVCDPREVPDLMYPVPGGPAVADVLAAVERVAATGRILAVAIAATWRHTGGTSDEHRDLIGRLRKASGC